ncbi:helix-turn-helix domain-containing protein [Sphingomonas tagetis]|uniref:helix-turn-helix domain-containing protein n=1 Tax=Sphingomonas tagetis TaxID=2949092 RepID=UPI00345EB121
MDLAIALGLTRESVCRIEGARALPSEASIEGLMRLFDLDWPQLAIVGRSKRRPRAFPDTWRDELRIALGSALRAGRRAEGLTLRDLATCTGVSYSQLSRLERGECDVSRVLAEHPADRDVPRHMRRLQFTHPVLKRVAGKGWTLI